ncbi:C-terminal processing protease CtpA/Prc, contains a PDZ domain [Chitinophaga jiangningensis]|uniref:C-terminal processing protease CtpA/Prc, contains a PDZ domain n=2 Tax=Chitinophaga jiangningensis TaxID=1419482 RepID=A0A1M7DNL8_9BACT|nr:C-terminal processing protease CtpA/Prc, contains a PDZ domain [Chitinophaga jiangningensis]
MRPKNLLLTAGVLLMAAACRKDTPVAPAVPTGPVTQAEINSWMLDSMRYFYLWNQGLPATADTSLTAQKYFYGLLNIADPFSYIYNPDDATTVATSLYRNYGLDISVVQLPGTTKPVGVVKLVASGATLAQSKFSRGSYITRVNNISLTPDNAAELFAQVLGDKRGSFTPATLSDGVFTEGQPVELSFAYPAESPVNVQQFSVAGKKVGYLYYNAFADKYNLDLINIFKNFIGSGVTELILDLRYNTGGSIAAAALMTSLIADGVTESSAFIQLTGNNNLGSYKMSFGETLAVPESGSAISFSSLVAARLRLKRVYVLTGHQTISAAELVVNNLKPYTNVIQIGATTYGKDKGAIIIRDQRTPKRIPWVMQPIIYRLGNANGQGGYTSGITPQYAVDEMSVQPLPALGTSNDVLIAKALALISGSAREALNRPRVPVLYETTPVLHEIIIPRIK